MLLHFLTRKLFFKPIWKCNNLFLNITQNANNFVSFYFHLEIPILIIIQVNGSYLY